MRDVAVRPLAWAGVAIALVVAGTVGAVLALLHAGDVAPGGSRLDAPGGPKLAAPDLASAPQDDLARHREAKRARLASAGWVDRQAGIAHIPIDDAMDQLVRERQARKEAP